MKHEERPKRDEGKSGGLRPVQRFVEINCREARKNDQRNDFLDRSTTDERPARRHGADLWPHRV